jgi:hypothetical protein
VWFTPPAAAEDDPDTDDDPRITVNSFVAWYNVTYIGVEGSRAKPIPDCWRQHPGLAMEVANLAYSWRTANLGHSASTARHSTGITSRGPASPTASRASGYTPTVPTARTAPPGRMSARTVSVSPNKSPPRHGSIRNWLAHYSKQSASPIPSFCRS